MRAGSVGLREPSRSLEPPRSTRDICRVCKVPAAPLGPASPLPRKHGRGELLSQ